MERGISKSGNIGGSKCFQFFKIKSPGPIKYHSVLDQGYNYKINFTGLIEGLFLVVFVYKKIRFTNIVGAGEEYLNVFIVFVFLDKLFPNYLDHKGK